MDHVVRAIDRLSGLAGGLARVAALAAVLICFAAVYLRYAVGTTWIWLNESYLWANAFAIVLAAGWAWRDGAMVRVDVFYERLSPRGRAVVDLAGIALFLLPFLAVVALYSLPFVEMSWRMNEGSPQPGGLPAVWLLKGALLVLVGLLAVQAVAEFLRNLAILRRGS